ncbi:fungal-specific transcription factor domain-containing protein [Aspergillus karnatakaensis]|uniref:Zn(II)2Cys6 transcription factor n=1 Tax=Aspergillus karnatakaensis TaxID=1810916 RepID=UPI003CCCC31F
MASAIQGNASCWTCRLRRKKCDQKRPICGVCSTLDISCYSDPQKPEWMDNGAKQQDMVQRFKVQVKRSAERRRKRRLIQRVARDLDAEEDMQIPATGLNSTAGSSTARATSVSGVAHPTPDFSTPPDSNFLTQRFDNELELQFIMVYLDYAFPVLFPFYTPTIFEGGRGWLLVLPLKVRALYHTIISLTSCFFSTVPVSPGPGYDRCSSMACGEQTKQLDLAVTMVQRDLHAINSQGVHSDLLESSYLLASIVQLLIFEGLTAKTETWKMHLDAAVVLFEQMIQPSGSISSVLDLMGQRSSLPSSVGDNLPWNADQAAFRFYSTVLLIADILASTALEQAPKLQKYHDNLLHNTSSPNRKPHLRIEDILGCETWVFPILSEIAALAAWKKDMKRRRRLTTTQLVQRAATIEQKLQEGLSRINSTTETPTNHLSTPPLENNIPYPYHQPNNHPPTQTVTAIWAHAARIYLHVTLSGWQTATPEIRDSVTATTALFRCLPSPSALRALAWPFCVVGCVAEGDERVIIRGIVEAMGPLGLVGTVQAAVRVMEGAETEGDDLDVAGCLRRVGYVVLLL